MINHRLFDWYGIDTNKNLNITNRCPRPFDTVLIDKQGSCYLCECTSWLPQSVGNLHVRSLNEILNSSTAKVLRDSINDKSYRYCNLKQCTWLIKNDVKHYNDTVPKLKSIRLAIDESCNLSCPSCRTKIIFEKDKNQLKKKYLLADKVIDYLKTVKTQINIHVGSDGDPFASLVYRYLIRKIKNFNHIKFSIQTNGLLIKKMYDKNIEMFDRLDQLNISIDGATKKTYEALRRGGSYEKILENLEFVSKLDKNFVTNLHMVVQKSNWREMPLMLELAKKFNINSVYYNRIQDWNTYQNFENLHIPEETNEFKDMFKTIKNDPIAITWVLSQHYKSS